MPKTIAELRQDLQDAGRDVRMAGEMVERATGGSQQWEMAFDSLSAVAEARSRAMAALVQLNYLIEQQKALSGM